MINVIEMILAEKNIKFHLVQKLNFEFIQGEKC